MISILIKSAIVLAVAAGIAAGLRRQSAALRHAIWTAGLIGALIIPLCSITLPAWQNAVVGRVEGLFHAAIVRQNPASVEPDAATVTASDRNRDTNPGTAMPPRSVSAGSDSGTVATSGRSMARIGIIVWLSGAAIGFLLMLFGALRLAWVAIHSEPLNDPRWTALAEDVRRSLGLRRPVRLLQSSSGHFLGTWGILVPRVLLPANASEWSDDRAWMVMGHELAHIKRHDWVVQVLAEAARAIYWFNPIFWLSYSRLRRESEHACDDTVVRMGAAGTRYAEELLELARALRSEDRLQSPILAMAQPSHLERRLVALLNPALNRLAATPWSVVVVALVAVGLTLPLAAVRAPETAAVPAPVIASVAEPAAPPSKPADGPLNGEKPLLAKAESVKIEPPKPETAHRVLPEEPPDFVKHPIEIQPDVPLSALKNAAPALITKLIAPTVAEPKLPPPPFECKVTASIQETKSKIQKSPLGSGPWHINEDRTIWTWDQPYIAGTPVNTMWMKPDSASLVITGRRLDGDSAPLKAISAKDSTAGYIATSLTFPRAGCWEVTATAGSSTLTFITKVDSQ